jgi:ribonuclease HII
MRMARREVAVPAFEPFEAEARAAGYRWIAGVDEAGRGPLAGPVVAAAVLLPEAFEAEGLHDSKRLTAWQRERLYGAILSQALGYGLGIVSHRYIDCHNILQATREAMRQAVAQLTCVPDLVLVDGVTPFPAALPQRTLVRGDARCASIAAASIVAKVTRDRLMVTYAKRYPAYGFERHKGYPTREHYQCLRAHGPCAIHRLTFRGVLVSQPEQER